MAATVERTTRLMFVGASLFLASCGGPAARNGEQGSSKALKIQATSDLDALATESGAISDDRSWDPVGSYGRVYEGGEDRLCILPAGGQAARYRVAVDTRVGDEEYCRGSGSAQRVGDMLVISLRTGRCTITARYEGDQIVLPGAVDRACASLCSVRGSLAGVTFPRIGVDAAAARDIRDAQGKPLCAA